MPAIRLLLVMAAFFAFVAIGRGAESARPGWVSAYDLMTDADRFYLRYLDPDPAVETASEWPIVKHIVALGGNLIDASVVADCLNLRVPVDGQPSFRHVQTTIDECSKILGAPAPAFFVEANPAINAYVTRLKEPNLLVLTSGLYNLYKDKPEELRYIVGHELGHLKCKHLKTHLVARLFVDALVTEDRARGFAQDFVAHLMIGQLLSWYRESEISADRAGLICVGGNLEIAKQALWRLGHGTAEKIDPELAAKQVASFERLPFVKTIRRLRAYRTTHPFLPERCLALQEWTTTQAYADLMRRSGKEPPKLVLVVDEVRIANLPNSDTGLGSACDPVIRVSIGDQEFKSETIANNNHPELADLDWRGPFEPNLPLHVEVEDYDSASGNDFIGACLARVTNAGSGPSELTVNLRRDVKEPCSAVDLPAVTVKYHFEKE